MSRLLPTTASLLPAAGTLGLIGFAYLLFGTEIYSPGGLNAEARPAIVRNGVRSHAETAGNCSACHAPPFSQESMADRCLNCHVEVRDELADHRPLHGTLGDAQECRTCHSEHHGPTGELTSFEYFDHALTAFPLTGSHRTTACAACHQDRVYKGTPQSCVGCHADPPIHRGRFGLNCAGCHSTTTWRGATFAHSFPLNHGGGGNKGKDCAVCHQQADQYRTYTCYGCHRHDPVKTAEKHLKWNLIEIAACAKCHPTGRKRPDLPPKRKKDDLTDDLGEILLGYSYYLRRAGTADAADSGDDVR
jgi:hypothetical protein